MKKNFFYVALGLMGIVGTLSIGVVSADWTISYGDTVTSVVITGDDSARNTGFEYKTITISSGTTSYVLMDRNLGARVAWDGSGFFTALTDEQYNSNSDYYGYYYQWGNNWGFSSNTTTGQTGKVTVNSSDMPSKYSSSTWINFNPWFNITLWKPENDLWGNITNTDEARQGPCPTGWHVPSSTEWSNIRIAWCTSKSYSGSCTNSQEFAEALQMPNAGYRTSNTLEFSDRGSRGYYWSSSPYPSNDNNAYYLFFYTSKYGSNIDPQIDYGRSYGLSVRCLMNSPTQTLTFFTVTVGVSPVAGGSVSTGSIEAVSGSSITGTIEAGTGFIKSGDVVLSTVTPNPGYIFSGWTTDCGETLTANCTFTGELKEITYEVVFSGNSVSTGKVEVTSGSVVNLTGNEIASSDTKDGYLFVGWNTDSGANEGLSNITVTGDITLFSIFQPITYIVSYDANGGIGSIANSGYTYDLSGNLAENTFTKTGYVFSGWKYNDEIYTGNQEIKNLTGINGATVTMVTQWKPITYSVEFTGTDVSGTMANQEFTYDISQDLTANSFTKTGYTFSGWTDGTTGYANSQNVSNLTTTDGATVTLTAQWTPITYSVEFTGTDVSGTMANQEFTYDAAQTLTANAFTKTGYTFSGWTDGTTGYADKQNVNNLTTTDGATVTLTAQWTPITYSVEFTGTDVSGTMSNQDFTYDVAQNLTANVFTKTGYTFSGWTDGITGYANSQNVSNLTTTDGATVTLTAQWTPIIYTISFSGNSENATGTAPITINAKYDSGDIAPDNTFTMTGYTFTGWNTKSDGSGTGYVTGDTLINLTTTSGAEVKLYAQWEVNVHKLNFVVDGTNIQSGDVAYSSGISAFLPSEPKKDCNSFAGWTSNVEGLTTTGTMPDSDVTFTANWNYTCSRSSGGGGGGSSRNTEKTTETQTGSKVDSSTKATDNEDNTQDSSAEDTEGQNQGKTYSDEFQQAYEFAYKHGITTMPTIEQANMEGPLTRIAMAKMLSYYAINVLGLKPDETRVNKFNDVSDQMDAEYNNAVSLAYQLGIMGINMPKNNFRPNDLVTRAEFATALSRMLYKIADGKDKYYSTHLAKLMEEKIITNNNPDLQELRGYVMIMLMRSAK